MMHLLKKTKVLSKLFFYFFLQKPQENEVLLFKSFVS